MAGRVEWMIYGANGYTGRLVVARRASGSGHARLSDQPDGAQKGNNGPDC
jgi:short subunit dehydrogenase-like uncharacterized protein